MAAASNPEVQAYVEALPAERQADARSLVAAMEKATGAKARLWGSIVGFGDLHYRYESGREGDTFVLGFASRKDSFVLYLGEKAASLTEELAAIGPHKAGKGCVYVKRLEDLDPKALATLLKKAARK